MSESVLFVTILRWALLVFPVSYIIISIISCFRKPEKVIEIVRIVLSSLTGISFFLEVVLGQTKSPILDFILGLLWIGLTIFNIKQLKKIS